MATNLELEARIKGLEKGQEEAQGAVRSLGNADSNLVAMLSKLSAENAQLKVDVANLKITVNKLIATVSGQRSGANVTNY